MVPNLSGDNQASFHFPFLFPSFSPCVDSHLDYTISDVVLVILVLLRFLFLRFIFVTKTIICSQDYGGPV